MDSPALVALAILKVNWDAHRRSYLDNFVPMVAECIRLSPEEVVSSMDVKDALQRHFGLNVPEQVVRKILRRVRAQGYIRLEDRAYKRNDDALANLRFHEVQQRVVAMHEDIVRRLTAFCSERFGLDWTTEQAERALESYLRHSQLLVIAAATTGEHLQAETEDRRKNRYIVGSFVQHLQDTHSAAFDYLDTVAKGNMLARAIYLEERGRVQSRFRDTEVYLDTSLLMFALGHAGEARRDPAVELLDLLHETGAHLRCFRHTFDEIKGVLGALEHRLDSGTLKDAWGPSMEYFVSQGYTASDVALFSAGLEADLRALRVQVVEKPPYIPEYVMDEKGFTDRLDGEIRYDNPRALQRDVDSVSAVMRLRRNRKFYAIEDCRAIFLTPNRGLERVSREFLVAEDEIGRVGACATDEYLTCLLWLKKPTEAPDLPRKRIAADCYAATQPDRRLWAAYLAEIERLRKEKRIRVDDYYLLRYDLEAKSALMDATMGDAHAFTAGTVPEILRHMRETMEAEAGERLLSKVELWKQRGEQAAAEAESVRAKEITRRARIRDRASTYGRTVARVAMWVGFILLSVGSFAAFYGLGGRGESPASAVTRYVLALGLGVLLLLSVLSLLRGTTVLSLGRSLELAVSRWAERKLLALGEGPEQAGEDANSSSG